VVYLIILSVTEGKRPLGKPTPRWEDNIKVYLKEIVGDGISWIDMVQNRKK